MSTNYFFLKRTSDLILSLFALAALSPLLLFVTLVLCFTGERQVFYFQDRVGYKNRVFKIWKFATMKKDSTEIGTRGVTLRNDFRVTAFGRLLRLTKVNELPQLFNVLLGDMSIVGPRPLMLPGFHLYSDHFKSSVYEIKPGLTGIGSIVFRDEERILSESTLDPYDCYQHVILPYKGELELWYQEHQSTCTDLKIIFLTGWVILFPHSGLLKRFFPDLPERPLTTVFRK